MTAPDIRHPLADNRELRVEKWKGLLVLTVHDLDDDGRCSSGPLCVRLAEIDTVAMALMHARADEAPLPDNSAGLREERARLMGVEVPRPVTAEEALAALPAVVPTRGDR